MKALLMEAIAQLSYVDVPLPECGDQDVLVRIMACAICGSDVHGWDGSSGRRLPPIIMGHEASGIVERVGRDVSKVRPGDRVTFDSMVFCGSCSQCRSGRTNLCENLSVLGVTFRGRNRAGAYAEYAAVPEQIVYRLPAGVPFIDAALTEPLSVAWHAARRFPLEPEAAVMVVGTGIIGSLLVKVLKQMGQRRIVAVDISPSKLERALRFGATDAVLSGSPGGGQAGGGSQAGSGAQTDKSAQPDCDEALRALAPQGFDAAFDVIGLEGTVGLCIRHLRDGGALGLIGNVQKQIAFPLQDVVTREIRLSGSYGSAREYDRCLQTIADREITVSDMVSAVAPMSEGNGWFQRLHDPAQGLLKVVLVPDSAFRTGQHLA